MSGTNATRVPKWVFWLAPLVLAAIAIGAFVLAPTDLGNYRLGDVYTTATPTTVVTFGKDGYPRFLVSAVGTMLPGYETVQYTLSPGTQLRVTRIHDANNLLHDAPRMPPRIYAEILNGPHRGSKLDVSQLSTIRDQGTFRPKADPSPTYLILVTRGSGKQP